MHSLIITSTHLMQSAATSAKGALSLVVLVAQQGDGGFVTQSSGTSFVVEAVITAALFGLALWMICKSSRRV
jgi:hypothetical protein